MLIIAHPADAYYAHVRAVNDANRLGAPPLPPPDYEYAHGSGIWARSGALPSDPLSIVHRAPRPRGAGGLEND